MIVKSGSKYNVVSESGKNLGAGYSSREEAAHRLAQVEYFKHAKGKKKHKKKAKHQAEALER